MILTSKTILDFIQLADKSITIPDNHNVIIFYDEKDKTTKLQISGYSRKHITVQAGYSQDVTVAIEPTDGTGKVYFIMEAIRKLDPNGPLFVNIPKGLTEEQETPVYEETTKITTHCKTKPVPVHEKIKWQQLSPEVGFNNRSGLMQLRKVVGDVTCICVPYPGEESRSLDIIDADITLAPQLEKLMSRKSTKAETKVETKTEDINATLAVAAAESTPVQPPLPQEYWPTDGTAKAEGPILPPEDAALIAQADKDAADAAASSPTDEPVNETAETAETEEQKEKRKGTRRSAAMIREDEKTRGMILMLEDGYKILSPLGDNPRDNILELVKRIGSDLQDIASALKAIPTSSDPDPVQIEILATKKAAEIIAKIAVDLNK